MRILTHLVLVLIGTIVALVSVEIFLHVFPQYLPYDIKNYVDLVSRDLDVIQKLRQNVTLNLLEGGNGHLINFSIRTISIGIPDMGVRDDGLNESVPFGIALGDSFTLGTGVELNETWPEILENELGKDIVNMGMFGTTTLHQYNMVKKYGLNLKPQVVILGVVAYDIPENYQKERHKKLGALYDAHLLLFEYSHIYKLLMFRSAHFIGKNPLEEKSRTVPLCFEEYCDTFNFEQLVETIKENTDGLELTKIYIKKIYDITKSNGINLIVVLIPTKEMVFFGRSDKSSLRYDPNLYDSCFPNCQIKEFCNENNIRCLDLLSEFKKQIETGKKVYIPYDGHLLYDGHKIVAGETYKILNK